MTWRIRMVSPLTTESNRRVVVESFDVGAIADDVDDAAAGGGGGGGGVASRARVVPPRGGADNALAARSVHVTSRSIPLHHLVPSIQAAARRAVRGAPRGRCDRSFFCSTVVVLVARNVRS